ncbi:MAG: SpaH/EbpB family LPXTG-anchored major pilin [Candidatus Limivicinus sp.]|nr:SpaH/EbpB family LPXTG-anchored major pilin [Candidatus Limivicinus sp.]
MKHAKKFASLLLALVMVFALGTTAFAAGTNSITVKNAVKDQEYKLYKMLDLVVDTDLTAYSYTVNSAWADFFKAAGETTPAGKGLSYVNIDAQGYVTWKDGADVAAFAKDAEAFAKQLTALETHTATVDEANAGQFTFEGLEAGYYLVTSTLGTKAIVGTTPGNPNPKIQEKNAAPENVKTVEEDSTSKYGEKNDADIGQTVNFKSTITAQTGAENYVFHDTMSAGLTLDKASIKVNNVAVTDVQGNDLPDDNYTVSYPSGEGTDGCTFEIAFAQSYLDTITQATTITITYSAELNENAEVGLEGNPNESKLSYGVADSTTGKPSGTTPPSTTTTYTWDVDVFKYTKNGETETALAGAKFTLSKSADGSNPIALVSEGNNVYRVAKTGTVTEITTDTTGKFTIKGLDADTYYLTETAAPAGYNKQAGPTTIVIGENGTVSVGGVTASEVKILNQSGTELPSTGGMGTTIFYVLGSILVVGAAVLLVTRKRMSTKG